MTIASRICWLLGLTVLPSLFLPSCQGFAQTTKSIYAPWAHHTVEVNPVIRPRRNVMLSMATPDILTLSRDITISDPALEEVYRSSFAIIDACSVSGKPTENLYDAVRAIDKNAGKLYPSIEDKEALWERCHGSWQLQLATGGGKFTTFKPIPHPLFTFAVIDETDFGNGIGVSLFGGRGSDNILLALRGPHDFLTQRRQMTIGIDDMFLWRGSFRVTESLPGFIKDGMGLGKRKEDFKKTKQRPPAFTMIAASEKSLIARGGTGGIAIWTRMDHDIRPLAYGDSK